jgi:hypothetical protein
MWMSEISNLYSQTTSEDTGNATSLQESLFGVTPSDSPAGPMTEKYGQEAVPVLPSRQQAKARGLMMLVTSGLIGYDSSESASLQLCLENRLMTRLDTAGSTLFKLTWKRRRTPLGRSYLERAASVRRTSGKDFTSVPTPQTHDVRTRGNTEADHHYYPHDLSNAAMLATVATPRSEDSQCAGAHRGTPDTLHSQTKLAAVTTPSARDWKDSSGMSESGVDPDGSIRTRLDQLPRQAQLADSGQTRTGGTGATESIGQLDPEYSRWLMGLPPVFSSCADTAMQLTRKSRKRLSKRTKVPEVCAPGEE